MRFTWFCNNGEKLVANPLLNADAREEAARAG